MNIPSIAGAIIGTLGSNNSPFTTHGFIGYPALFVMLIVMT